MDTTRLGRQEKQILALQGSRENSPPEHPESQQTSEAIKSWRTMKADKSIMSRSLLACQRLMQLPPHRPRTISHRSAHRGKKRFRSHHMGRESTNSQSSFPTSVENQGYAAVNASGYASCRRWEAVHHGSASERSRDLFSVDRVRKVLV